MERLRSQQSDNILGRTDDFYVRVCSSALPPPKNHCQFMLYFPHSLRIAMDFQVSLQKTMYPRKWRTFPDDMDLWISFRFVKGADDVSKDEEVSDGESDSEVEMERVMKLVIWMWGRVMMPHLIQSVRVYLGDE